MEYFVYILRSLTVRDQIYIGCTRDIKKRLSNHNSGTTNYTSKYRPWDILVYICFKEKERAFEFEKYLKSGSGREFLARRFL